MENNVLSRYIIFVKTWYFIYSHFNYIFSLALKPSLWAPVMSQMIH